MNSRWSRSKSSMINLANLPPLAASMSIILPGVHTITSAPRFSSAICSEMPVPPYTHTTVSPKALQKRRHSLEICMASSRVGVRTTPTTYHTNHHRSVSNQHITPTITDQPPLNISCQLSQISQHSTYHISHQPSQISQHSTYHTNHHTSVTTQHIMPTITDQLAIVISDMFCLSRFIKCYRHCLGILVDAISVYSHLVGT